MGVAEGRYFKALELNPTSVEIAREYFSFIFLHKLFENFERALGYVEAVKTPENKVLGLVLRAEFARLQNDNLSQINFLKEAVLLNPTADMLQWDLANAYVNNGEVKSAIILLKNYLSKSTSPQLAFKLAILLRGRNEADNKDSLNILLQLSQKYPLEPMILMELSKTQMQMGEKSKAIETARRALQLNNLDASLLENMGNILLKEGNYKEAFVFFEKAKNAKK